MTESVPRRVRRSALAVAVALGAFLLVVPHATAESEGDTLLARARAAATRHDFVGTVAIAWQGRNGPRTAEVPVLAAGGAVEVGSGRGEVIARGDDRWRSTDGTSTLWRDAGPTKVPRPSEKWDLATDPGPAIVGRLTTLVEASDRNGRVRARLFVDRLTGLLLRREVLDRHGKVVHSVGFVNLAVSAPGVDVDVSPPPTSAVRGHDRIKNVPDDFEAPGVAGDGYKLVGRYREGDGVVQLLYSDGLFSVSVFEQSGELDWGALPAGGHDADVAEQPTRAYETASGTVLFWSANGEAFTAVSDAPVDEVQAIVGTFVHEPRESGSNAFDDAVDFVLGPFSWG